MGKWVQEPTIEKWKGEQAHVHRAMLLWMMQRPGSHPALSRSLRATARAVGRSEGCIRDWSRTHKWEERSRSVPDCEAEAVALYRQLYLQDYGEAELPEIASRVVVPMHPDNSADQAISQAKQVSTAAQRVEQAVLQDVAERRKVERQKVERFRGLVDAALGETARLLTERKLSLTARDIPSLLNARQGLTDWLNANDDRHIEGQKVVESARVKHAKDVGGDVLEAVWEDVHEIRTILAVLRTKRDTDTSTIHETFRRSAPDSPDVIDSE